MFGERRETEKKEIGPWSSTKCILNLMKREFVISFGQQYAQPFSSMVILYDLFEGKGRPSVSAATFDRSSQQIAVGFEDSTVVVVNVRFDEPVVVKHLKWVVYSVEQLTFRFSLNVSCRVESLSLTGTHLAFAIGRGFSGSMYVWDLKSEIFVVKQQSHTKPILCVAYSPLGIYLATGGEDNVVGTAFQDEYFV